MRKWSGKLARLDVGLSARLLAIASIFLLSFLTFNILFKASGPNDYFKEIIAALIGTILAAVITTLLLRSQSQGEELKERNVEVFSKKLTAYESFLDATLTHLNDNSISDAEAHDLRRLVYKMALFSSEATIEVVSRYVRCMYVRDDEGNLQEVISAFRTELALENVDELSTSDLSAVDTLLRSDAARSNVETTKSFLVEFGQALAKAIARFDSAVLADAAAEFANAYPHDDGLAINGTLASGSTFYAHMSYSDKDDTVTVIEAFIDFDHLPIKKRKAITAFALALGFQLDPNDPEDVSPSLMATPDLDATESDEGDEGERIWTVQEIAKALVEIEHKIPAKKVG